MRDPVREFREMVRAFHEAGIEVWLDVVYNHTAEGDQNGPTYSMRGLDNTSYYLVQPDGSYRNDSGCGNTTRCAHPMMRVLVLRSLRYWAEEMHVDGFRFDLASVFARDSARQRGYRPAGAGARDRRGSRRNSMCAWSPRRGTSARICWAGVFPA